MVGNGSAATWSRRRCAVEHVEEEEEDFFFPLPKRYLGPGWLGLPKWAGLVGFGPGKSFPPFFLF
jgi:hypothetical protein